MDINDTLQRCDDFLINFDNFVNNTDSYICVTDIMKLIDDKRYEYGFRRVRLADVMSLDSFKVKMRIVNKFMSSHKKWDNIGNTNKIETLHKLREVGLAYRIGKSDDQKWFVDPYLFAVIASELSLSLYTMYSLWVSKETRGSINNEYGIIKIPKYSLVHDLISINGYNINDSLYISRTVYGICVNISSIIIQEIDIINMLTLYMHSKGLDNILQICYDIFGLKRGLLLFLHISKFNTINKNVSDKTYVIKDSSNGLYKIGKTCNINKRFATIKISNASIELILVSNENIESKMHKKFKSKRVSGEWFSLNDYDLKVMRTKYGFAKL